MSLHTGSVFLRFPKEGLTKSQLARDINSEQLDHSTLFGLKHKKSIRI